MSAIILFAIFLCINPGAPSPVSIEYLPGQNSSVDEDFPLERIDDRDQDHRCGKLWPDRPNKSKKCTGSWEDSCCSHDGYCYKRKYEDSTAQFCTIDKCDPTYGNCGLSNECGPKKKEGKCTGKFEGQCCSKNGKCGTTEDFCKGSNCDPKYGRCGLEYECGKQHNNKQCSGSYKGKCCSRNGYCGTGDSYCLPRNCWPGSEVCGGCQNGGYCGPKQIDCDKCKCCSGCSRLNNGNYACN